MSGSSLTPIRWLHIILGVLCCRYLWSDPNRIKLHLKLNLFFPVSKIVLVKQASVVFMKIFWKFLEEEDLRIQYMTQTNSVRMKLFITWHLNNSIITAPHGYVAKLGFIELYIEFDALILLSCTLVIKIDNKKDHLPPAQH